MEGTMKAPIVPKQILLAELRCSLLQALNHAASQCEVPELCASLSSRSRSQGTDVQISIVWSNSPHPVVRCQQWDRLASTGLTQDDFIGLRKDVTRLCETLGIALVSDCGWHQPEPDPPMPVLYRYHPCRLQALRNYGERLDAAALQIRSGSTRQLEQCCRDIVREEAQQRIRTPLRHRLNASQLSDGAVHRYLDAVIAFAAFSACARPLYDFSLPLTRSLRTTDSDKIHLNDVRLPHPALYLHFGRQADLDLGGTWAPEGAYVRETWSDDGVREIVLTFVAAPADAGTFLDFDRHVEPVFQLSLEAKAERRSLRRVFIAGLIDAIERSRTEPPNRAGADGVSALPMEGTEQGNVLFARRRPYGEMVNLALNAMAFLSMCPQHVESGWPVEAPSELVDMAMRSHSPRARFRARQELHAQGFCPVHACRADSLCIASAARPPALEDHFLVRGFWREREPDQADGHAKLAWVPPVPSAAPAAQARAPRQQHFDNPLHALTPHTKGMRMH